MPVTSDRTRDGRTAQPEPHYYLPEHVRSAHGPEGATVLDIHHGQMFRFNFVASRILEFLKQGLAESEIAEQLAREFRIERFRAETDVREFLLTLQKHHLLSSQANSSAI